MPIELTVVTPEQEVFSGAVDDVVLPGTEGDFGVLEKHERFLAPLRIGEVGVKRDGTTHWAAISEGFAQVTADKVIVLVDTCEVASKIDVARAEAAKARAERALKEIEAGQLEETRLHTYEAALQRAVIRIQVAGRDWSVRPTH